MDEKEYVELDRLSRSGDVKDRKKVAQNRHTPAEILERLSRDEADEVRAWVAEHRSTPADTLRRLYEENAELVRWRLARNTKAPAELLLLLCRDRDESVRWRLIGNRALPREALDILAADKGLFHGEDVRAGVAVHFHTSQDTLRALASDGSWRVRWKVVKNPTAGASVLFALSRDSNAEISSEALAKFNSRVASGTVSTVELENLVRETHGMESDFDLSGFPREVLLEYLY